MNNERWILLLMYDLPTGKHSTILFMKNVKKLGYMRIQKSIYVKLFRNKRLIRSEIDFIREVRCIEGDIKVLPMRLEDFRKMISIAGHEFQFSLFSDDIAVI